MHREVAQRLDNVAGTSDPWELERIALLDSLGPSSCALHRRRLPGARVGLDHVLIAPTGVFTIEAHDQAVRMDPQAGELWVGSRRRSRLLDQARDQADAIARVLADDGVAEVPVHPVLCCRAVQWPLLVAPSAPGDVRVVDTRGLAHLADGDPALTSEQVWQVVDLLDRCLDAARDAIAVPDTGARTPAPDAAVRSAPGSQRRNPDLDNLDPDTLVVTPATQGGKRRLYVTRADGTPLGFVDLRTQAIVPDDPRHHNLVREAASKHLQDT